MIIDVVVSTNKKFQSINQEGSLYKICLKSKAVKGKANKELLKLLKDYFKKQPRIITGLTGRKKRVELL